MTLKAYWHPLAFRRSFVMPGQALFFPTPFLSFAAIFVSLLVFVHPHAGPKFVDVLHVFYWIYVGAATLCAVLLQWSMYDQNREFETITPSECLPIFPIMLAGTIGSALANALDADDKRAVTVLIASYIFQGCGFWIAQLKLSTWISRNVLFGHPSDTRIMPIFFMAVGPPGFTAFALLQLGSRAAEVFPVQGVLPTIPNAGDMVFAASWVLAVFIFGQCLWFLLATTVIWVQVIWKSGRRVGWGMAWFATTFPLGTLMFAWTPITRADYSCSWILPRCGSTGCTHSVKVPPHCRGRRLRDGCRVMVLQHSSIPHLCRPRETAGAAGGHTEVATRPRARSEANVGRRRCQSVPDP